MRSRKRKTREGSMGITMTRGSESKQPELRTELYMIESDGVRFVKTESPAASGATQPVIKSIGQNFRIKPGGEEADEALVRTYLAIGLCPKKLIRSKLLGL
jgi:hypothetical protein